MPTYQYRCTDCTNELEAVQRFTDPALTECPDCSGQLRKVFSPVGVVFKGSGFYATDNRTKGKANAAKPTESSTSSSSGEATKPESKSTDKAGATAKAAASSGASTAA